MTSPHSLTSFQGQSEDQFPEKSPGPPLASAPAGTLGSWPLPPPPGRGWYGCGYELVDRGLLKRVENVIFGLLGTTPHLSPDLNLVFSFCRRDVFKSESHMVSYTKVVTAVHDQLEMYSLDCEIELSILNN